MFKLLLEYIKNIGKSEIDIKIKNIFEDKRINLMDIYIKINQKTNEQDLDNQVFFSKESGLKKYIKEKLKKIFKYEDGDEIFPDKINFLHEINYLTSPIEKEKRIIYLINEYFHESIYNIKYEEYSKEKLKNYALEREHENQILKKPIKKAWEVPQNFNTGKKSNKVFPKLKNFN